jgi:hypothetical protein
VAGDNPLKLREGFTWRKLGRIFEPPPLPYSVSHAAVPTALHLGGGRYRVYFGGRDASPRSLVAWWEFDIKDPSRVLEVAPAPVLSAGALGTFDDSGCTPFCLLPMDGALWLFYVGWNRGYHVPFYNSIGLAQSSDGGLAFQRRYRGPAVRRDDLDPIFTASPWVLHEGGRLKLWYLSCVAWEQTEEGLRHRYDLRYAESDDGVNWQKHPTPILTFASPDEYAFSRPCVLRTEAGYAMWFSYRGDHYRIGFAESPDGVAWQRRPYGGIDVSSEGWDSEMVEYPFVFRHDGRLYMLYNGNNYGETGVGLAVAE